MNVFIYDLFNQSVRISKYGGIISEWRNQNVDRSGRGLIWGIL
jgi:hypothetical protein